LSAREAVQNLLLLLILSDFFVSRVLSCDDGDNELYRRHWNNIWNVFGTVH